MTRSSRRPPSGSATSPLAGGGPPAAPTRRAAGPVPGTPLRHGTRADVAGWATAMALLRDRPDLRLTVLEKETAVATHQSGHNSGVLHAGLYYKPGSLKARFSTAGRAELARFADEHGIPYRVTGKL